VRTTEELLEGKVAAPVYKTEINDRGNPLRCPHDTLHPQNLALTSPISGGCSDGIVRSRTKAMEFSFSSITLVFTMLSITGGIKYKIVNESDCSFKDWNVNHSPIMFCDI
jgi:hypothetical protein